MTYECSCGSNTFTQEVTQFETVHTDDNGEPEQIEKNGEAVVHKVECCECGKVIQSGEE